jgi:hypothetical protein
MKLGCLSVKEKDVDMALKGTENKSAMHALERQKLKILKTVRCTCTLDHLQKTTLRA